VKQRKPALRIIFAGTPEFALPPLQALIDAGHEIVAVLTKPDRPAGRGKHLRASPVKRLALENGLDVLQPETLRDKAWQEKLAALKPDLMVVVAYGLMVPASVLQMPGLGCWNIHASLLPRWRGAAPIHRSIEAGDEQTGVCIMQMEVTLDTGPVYQCLTTPIGPTDTTGVVHDRLAGLGAVALLQCIELAATDTLPKPLVQDEKMATYAHKLSKAEARLDWNETAETLARKVRAFNPWPVAWCELGDQRIRIWQAEVVDNMVQRQPGEVLLEQQSLIMGTADKSLKIMELQRAGGQKMTTMEFLKAIDPAFFKVTAQQAG
jgi:methionyl-tRNA formyltransferase